MRLVVLGAPGSGKRTQASLVAKAYRLTMLTSAELVKAAMSEESEQGLQLRLLQEAGQAVTEDVILSLLRARLLLSDVLDGFLLDGFPRNLLQALTLDEMLAEIGKSIDYVVLIHIETDTLMERLVGRRTCRVCGTIYNIYTHPTVVEDVCDACGGRLHRRHDDNEETVSNRLHVFDHLTSQLLSHYGKQGKVLRVDGDGEVDEVFTRVCEALDIAARQPRAELTPSVSMEIPAAEQTPLVKAAPSKEVTAKQPVTAAAKSAAGGAQLQPGQGGSAAGTGAKRSPPKKTGRPTAVLSAKKQSSVRSAASVKSTSPISKSLKPSVAGTQKQQAVVKAITKTTKKQAASTKAVKKGGVNAAVKPVKKTTKAGARKAAKKTPSRQRR